MSYDFEVDPNLGSEVETDLEQGIEQETEPESVDIFSEYEGLYDEEGFRALGVDPGGSTEAKPGSDQKVLMLAARYASGLPLWHNSDCYDHGPLRDLDLEESV